jgi:thiamine biosynthesis lipoprotein
MPYFLKSDAPHAAARSAKGQTIPLNPGRRRLAGALVLGGMGWLTAPLLAAGEVPPVRGSAALMGTQVDISVDGADSMRLQQALQAALAEMQRLARMMSRYRSDNPLAELQHAAGRHPVHLPPEMYAVLKMAESISRQTGGAFDVTVGALSGWRFDGTQGDISTPAQVARELGYVNYRKLILNDLENTGYLTLSGMRVDLGGIAKLPILQAGMDMLKRHGVAGAMINGGGDVLVSGQLHGRPWRIGVRDPAAPERLLAVLSMNDGIVASSGDYERCVVRDGRRYHHIIDPATGYPTEQVHGVTLVGRSVAEVNGLGAAAMVLGPAAGAALLSRQPGRQALMVSRDGSLWVSPALAGRLLPPPGAQQVRGLG